jgi:hypothetical protein
MKQVFNIFKKDARQFWPEITASLLAQVLFAWENTREWHQPNHFGFQLAEALIIGSVFVSWWLLAIRVVHAEGLVGNRQFWLTRPYEWQKLLAAKALFVVAFIHLPSLLCCAFLLLRAGFNPLHFLPELVWSQLGLAVFFLLPAILLASFTATLGQLLLAMIGVALYIAGMIYLDPYMTHISIGRYDDLLNAVSIVLYLGSALAILLMQYSRREKRWMAVGIAVGCILVTAAISFFAPYQFLVNRNYPLVAAADSPVEIGMIRSSQVDHDGASESDSRAELEGEGTVDLRFPTTTLLKSSDALLSLRGVRLVLSTPGEVLWDSGWKSQYELLPHQPELSLQISMEGKIYAKLRDRTLGAHFEFAFAEYKDEMPAAVQVQPGAFRMAEAICNLEKDGTLNCLRPFVNPSSLLTKVFHDESPCRPSDGEDAIQGRSTLPNDYAYRWQSDDSFLIDFPLAPVLSDRLLLSKSRFDRWNTWSPVCAGTTLHISTPRFVRYLRARAEIPQMKPADYRSPTNIFLRFLPRKPSPER